MANRERTVQVKFRVTPEERRLIESRMAEFGTKNMGAYASLDYTKGDDIENPLQGVVGINVTW